MPKSLDLTPPAVRHIWIEPQERMITPKDHVVVHIDGVSDFESGIAEVICQYSLEGSVWQNVQATRLSGSNSFFISVIPPHEANSKVFYRVLIFDHASNMAQMPGSGNFEYVVQPLSTVSEPAIEDVLISPTAEVVSGERLAIAALVSNVCNPVTACLDVRYSTNPSDDSSWIYQPLSPIAQSTVWDALDSGVIFAGTVNVTSSPGTKLSIAFGFRDMWGQWVEDTNNGHFYNISVVAAPPSDTEAPILHHKFVSSYQPSTQDYFWTVLGISDDTISRVGYQTTPTSGIEVSINNDPYVSLFHPGFPMIDDFPAIIPGYFYGLDAGSERVVVVRCRRFQIGDHISLRQTLVDSLGQSVTDVTNFTIVAPSIEDTSQPVELAFQVNQAREGIPTDLVLGLRDSLSGLDIFGGCWLEFSLDGDSDYTNGPEDGRLPFNPSLPTKLPVAPGGISRIYYRITASDRAGEIFSTGNRFVDIQSHIDLAPPTVQDVYLAEGSGVAQGWGFDLILEAWDDSGIDKVIVEATSDNTTFKPISMYPRPFQMTENRFLVPCSSPGNLGSPISLNVTVFDYLNKNVTIILSSLVSMASLHPALSLSDVILDPENPYDYEQVVVNGNLSSLLGMRMFGYSLGCLWYNTSEEQEFNYPLFLDYSQSIPGVASLNGIIPGFPEGTIVEARLKLRSITGELESSDLGSYLVLEDSPPIVTIFNPQQGDILDNSTSITIRIEAVDPDGGISLVRYQIDALDWVDITSSYSGGFYVGVWDPQNDVGTHTLRAVAQDDRGFESEALVVFRVEKALGAILLVDDDEGALEEEPYVLCLDTIGISYDIWAVNDSGLPSAVMLLLYSTVLWILGTESRIGESAESLRVLEHFLSAGRSLLLAGPEVPSQLGWNPFFAHYLKCVSSEVVTGTGNITGVPTTPFANENLTVGLEQSFQTVVPIHGAEAVLKTYGGSIDNKIVGIGYNSTYLVLTFSFSLSMVGDNPSRTSLLNTSLLWLGVELLAHVQILPNDQPFSVVPGAITTFFVSVEPRTNIGSVQIRADGLLWEDITSSDNGSHYSKDMVFSEGWHELEARALFNDNIWIYSPVLLIIGGMLQESPPQIFLVEPDFKSNLLYNTTLRVKVLDNGTVTNVTAIVGNNSLIEFTQENQTHWFGILLTANPGLYTVEIYAEDDQGFTSVFITTFRKNPDATPPTLERLSPSESSILTKDATVFLSWNAYDLETGIKQMLVSINENDPFQVNGTSTILTLPIGNVSVTLIAQNSVDLETNSTFYVFVDVGIPQLVIKSPINETTTFDTQILVNWTVTDPEGFAVSSSIILGDKITNLGQNTSYLASLHSGWNNITIVVQDLAGNINKTTILVLRYEILLIFATLASVGLLGGITLFMLRSQKVRNKLKNILRPPKSNLNSKME